MEANGTGINIVLEINYLLKELVNAKNDKWKEILHELKSKKEFKEIYEWNLFIASIDDSSIPNRQIPWSYLEMKLLNQIHLRKSISFPMIRDVADLFGRDIWAVWEKHIELETQLAYDLNKTGLIHIIKHPRPPTGIHEQVLGDISGLTETDNKELMQAMGMIIEENEEDDDTLLILQGLQQLYSTSTDKITPSSKEIVSKLINLSEKKMNYTQHLFLQSVKKKGNDLKQSDRILTQSKKSPNLSKPNPIVSNPSSSSSSSTSSSSILLKSFPYEVAVNKVVPWYYHSLDFEYISTSVFSEDAKKISLVPYDDGIYICRNGELKTDRTIGILCSLDNDLKIKVPEISDQLTKFLKLEEFEKLNNSRIHNNDVGVEGLELFYTGVLKGWGLRCTQRIPKGTYVCEYVGKVVTEHEYRNMDKAEQQYGFTPQKEREHDGEYDDGFLTCVSYTKGNCSRWLSHSCNPNLYTVYVYFSSPTDRHIRVTFFASRDIKAKEELTIDYGFNYFQNSGACYCLDDGCRFRKPQVQKKRKRNSTDTINFPARKTQKSL